METVDVVIPTVGRSSLRRAVDSVRAQKGVRTRLHVVLDAPDAQHQISSFIHDGELTVTAGRTGGAHARNLGLAASTTRWVSYLDDDDWWAPHKLEQQVAAMTASGAVLGLCAATFKERHGGTRVLPRSAPPPSSFADYIVLRPDLTYGHSFVQSSCLIVDRTRAPKIEWDPSMPKHQDWDYAVRVLENGGPVAFVPEPLVYVQQGTLGSVSNLRAWEASRTWYERHHESLSARARGDFVASHVLRSALASRSTAGTTYALRQLAQNRPHFAALVTGLSGAREALSPRMSNTLRHESKRSR